MTEVENPLYHLRKCVFYKVLTVWFVMESVAFLGCKPGVGNLWPAGQNSAREESFYGLRDEICNIIIFSIFRGVANFE